MNKDGDTPLHIAAEKGDEALLTTMLALFCNSEKGELHITKLTF